MTITVVLHGTSSAGKTSIAEAIRAVSPLPWQISGIDTFLALVPDTMFAALGADAASEGFTWVAATVDGVPCWDVVPGAQALGFARAVHQYWAASAAEFGYGCGSDGPTCTWIDLPPHQGTDGGTRVRLERPTCRFRTRQQAGRTLQPRASNSSKTCGSR